MRRDDFPTFSSSSIRLLIVFFKANKTEINQLAQELTTKLSLYRAAFNLVSKKKGKIRLTDFIQKQAFHGTILISVIFCALIFPILFLYLLKISQQEVLALATKLERNWSNTVEYFGKLLNVMSTQTNSFQDREKTLSLLQQIYENLSPLVAYPAFGRADGKMFSYPPYDYGHAYDPRERPWYRAASRIPSIMWLWIRSCMPY